MNKGQSFDMNDSRRIRVFAISNKSVCACLMSVFFALIFSIGIFAQTIDTATIRGKVSDANGAIIVGAKVNVTNESTGLQRDAVTDGDGNYTVSNLPLTGKYKVAVSSSGFADTAKNEIQLRANETASVNFNLSPQGIITDRVTVTGTTESVQSDSAQLGTRLDLQKIDNTPILGRKVTNLVQLNSAIRPARGTGDLFLNNFLFVANGSGRRQWSGIRNGFGSRTIYF